MIAGINYVKRKNTELFQSFSEGHLSIDNCQNYIPYYDAYFSLTDANFNSINLNNPWHIHTIKSETKCLVKHATEKPRNVKVFFKLAPLIDPFKYVLGKYQAEKDKLLNLPSLVPSDQVLLKIAEKNNSAYVDGFFSYLTDLLKNNYGFVHGLDFYGSFLGIKNEFKVNIIEDLEYLCRSDFFNKNKGVLFEVDNYDYLFDSPQKLPTINITEISAQSELVFENLDEIEVRKEEKEEREVKEENEEQAEEIEVVSLKNSRSTTSTCSSRTSHTSGNSDPNSSIKSETEGEGEGDGEDEPSQWEDVESPTTRSSSFSDDDVFMTLPKFPVNVICMEHCEDTLDSLINSEKEIPDEEWFAILMQVIMMLLTYQKVFHMTHNDLHTNNIMFNKTTEKYLYYCFDGTTYRVPTFGRIYKIIDFGRAIYKYGEVGFCSDCFKKNEDAATQYNCEPYFNKKKPRLDPNYSFDLCRLACSIFDYVVEDMSSIKKLEECGPVIRLIVQWCLDDNGLNVLYKMNGDERYPDFKLYKMIARCVHEHTPKNQLLRPEFKSFAVSQKSLTGKETIMNIDKIPCLV